MSVPSAARPAFCGPPSTNSVGRWRRTVISPARGPPLTRGKPCKKPSLRASRRVARIAPCTLCFALFDMVAGRTGRRAESVPGRGLIPEAAGATDVRLPCHSAAFRRVKIPPTLQFRPINMRLPKGLTKPGVRDMLALRFNMTGISNLDSWEKFILWRENESESRVRVCRR